MVELATTIWADGPTSDPYGPDKAQIRAWGTWLEGIINAFTANGGLIFSSKASLDASLAYAANTMAWVIGDATVANNGVYGKVGASGVGSWTRRSDLPFSFIIASDVGAGTANAIQATTSIPVSASSLIWMNIFEANTATPVTVSFNGGSALTIKTNSGNDVAAGGLSAGMIVMGIVSGSTFRLVSDQASAAIVAAAEAAADRAEAAAAYVTGIDTVTVAEAGTFPNDVRFLQLLGRDTYGDGGAFKAVEITEDGSPLGPGQFKTNVNLKRWENAEDVITPAMFAEFREMLTFTKAQMRIPAGNYEFDGFITVRDNAVIRAEKGATFIPTFEPTGTDRANPLIDFGNGADINYLKLQLDAGINTIRKGFRFGDYSQIGYVECISADINLNRTESGSTDLISGAVLIDGDHVRIGQIYLSRFDRGWTVIDSTDVIIGKIRNLETLMGGYVHGTRDLHILAGYTTGATLAEATALSRPRGAMTPGLNSLLLAGCSDSSFSNWQSFDILEHGVRVGAMAAGTSVPNHRLSFINHRHYRPYGCGFKMDDADAFNIKRVLIQGLYLEDVGHDNWFGNPGYQNWSTNDGTNYVNTPGTDNDGNKSALAIRNSQHVTFSDFSNKTNAYANSGQIGLWIERSNYVQGSNIDTEKSRTDGVVIQSGGGTSPERIELRGVATRENVDSGLLLNAAASNDTWRGVQVLDIDSQNNGGYGVEVTARLDGGTPYATLASRIEGFVRGNTAGQVSINANVAADADFVNAIKERGTFTPTAAFAVVGTSTWAYSAQSGRYWVEGDRCFVEISIAMTPTIGTGSGNLRIAGLPYAGNGGVNNICIIETDADFSSWNSRVELVPTVQNGQTFVEIRGLAAAVGTSPIGATNMTSGAEHVLKMAGWYRI
ncbi:hypothetical protein PYH37_005229 [Sinorhizobium numidicum]|uniref:Uncharacterized protein n=1 Tax=Sinorhizobium numidicum TaxID=680248 RepID=A0ABY8CY12_9HYPH|nr:hypothetical protein [Sinorhizobium numidicum]WEX76878.1 hypothetical protein PYH37_005229 [Sinorhizobium numidicum]WEX83538.1 hypothetical protein PYH38_002322 [Sinorhizobium numidicum]